MEIKNSQVIPASPSVTWDALNDPDILAQCIPGCESLTKVSDTEMAVVMHAKVGPVGARFKGKMTLHGVNPPTSYTVVFEGQGGAMGFGKGEAKVQLQPVGEGTELTYVVVAQVGGKIAQVGARLIDAAALKIADDFFTRFKQIAQNVHEGAAARLADTDVGTRDVKNKSDKFWWWAALLLIFAAGYYFVVR